MLQAAGHTSSSRMQTGRRATTRGHTRHAAKRRDRRSFLQNQPHPKCAEAFAVSLRSASRNEIGRIIPRIIFAVVRDCVSYCRMQTMESLDALLGRSFGGMTAEADDVIRRHSIFTSEMQRYTK